MIINMLKDFLDKPIEEIKMGFFDNKSKKYLFNFKDNLSKKIFFDQLYKELKELNADIYSDFKDINITDIYNSERKLLRWISPNINIQIRLPFVNLGISYDLNKLKRSILKNSNSKIIILIRDSDALDGSLYNFIYSIARNMSYYENKYNKSFTIVIANNNDSFYKDSIFDEVYPIYNFSKEDLKEMLNKFLDVSINEELLNVLYPFKRGNLEDILSYIKMTNENKNPEEIDNIIHNTLVNVRRELFDRNIEDDFLYKLSVLPEEFNPYTVEEYLKLTDSQLEMAISILMELVVLVKVENRIDYYHLISIIREKLLEKYTDSKKHIYEEYYNYINKTQPLNYNLKIDILCNRLHVSQDDLLARYLLWYEQLVNIDNSNINKCDDDFSLTYLKKEYKNKFKEIVNFKYLSENSSLSSLIQTNNNLLKTIILKNDILHQSITNQNYSFKQKCINLYNILKEESQKKFIKEPVHYIACSYMLLPNLIDKLNDTTRFFDLKDKILKKFYISEKIEQESKALEYIYKRKSFLYLPNDLAINEINVALEFFKSINDKNEIYYSLGNLMGLYIINSDYAKAESCYNEIRTIKKETNEPLLLYSKVINNYLILNFLKNSEDTFEYFEEEFIKIKGYSDINDTSLYVIYTNLCSLALYYNKVDKYDYYKKELEIKMNVNDVSEIEDTFIDDFYRYYFSWFEICRNLLNNKKEEALRKYIELEDFIPSIYKTSQVGLLLKSKHKYYKNIFKLDISSGKEFSDYLKTSKIRNSAKEWEFYRRGLLVSDLQYTSVL